MQLNTILKTLPLLMLTAGLGSAAHAADVKLSLAAALTGPAAKYGVAIKNGFLLATDEVNAGGVNGAWRGLGHWRLERKAVGGTSGRHQGSADSRAECEGPG